MSESQKKLSRILKNDYGVRSGVYSAIDPGIKMEMDGRGEYQPVFKGGETEATFSKLLQVDMMSDESPDENKLGRDLYGKIKGIKHDPVLGYYQDLYVGYVREDDFRQKGSSGGATSWILAELLKQKEIDGVIHVQAVDPQRNQGKLFEYVISRNIESVKAGAKSRYYPMELSQVLKTVKKVPGRYAVVGIPEFITELRLLARVDPVIDERIVFTLGLVCGHQKTAKYAEALAWQQGIEPGNLLEIDFRVKQPHSTAIDYLHNFTGLVGERKSEFTRAHSDLFVDNWAAGFFKSKFSDFTDNAFNEVADVVLGDAWLPEYNVDGRGNNIIIVRNPLIGNIISRGVERGALKLDTVNAKTIKQSQAGLIHHIRDELPYRLSRQIRRGIWVPSKRTKPSSKLPYLRKKVQNIRYKMATRSHEIYTEAVKRKEWDYFELNMSRLTSRYNLLYRIIGWQKEGFGQVLRRKLRPRTRIKNFLRVLKHALRPRTRLKSVTQAIHKHQMWSKSHHADGAILTLTGFYNYGNIIQRFALQEFLRKEGHNFVSYWGEPFYLNKPEFARFHNTEAFVKKRIWRKPFDLRDNYRVYIVGSDQVWRNWSYGDEFKELGYYFLDFIDNPRVKKIAYAASFGVDSTERALVSPAFVKHASPLIKKFNAISMREESGVEIMRKTWNIESQVVLDPTMLLTVEDYSGLIDNPTGKIKDTKRIFTYILGVNDRKTKIIEKVEKALKLKAEKLHPYQLEVLPPVEQWLKGFRDAELVITDSFHGTVFAIINNTPFVVIENSIGGISRLVNLLKLFGLEDRLIAEAKAEAFDLKKLKPIEWDEVNTKVKTLREESAGWLIRALQK